MELSELYTEFTHKLTALLREAAASGLDQHEHILHAMRVTEDQIVNDSFAWE